MERQFYRWFIIAPDGSDHYTAQEDYFNNTQNDNQDHCDNMDNSEHESDNELDSS